MYKLILTHKIVVFFCNLYK